MATIQTCDICTNSLFPSIQDIRELIGFTMPLPLNRQELPIPALPTLPAPPQVDPPPAPISGLVRSFNEEKARFASELQNYQHLALIQVVTDAVIEKAQSLGLPIPPLPTLIDPTGSPVVSLPYDITDVLAIQPDVIIADLIPLMPDFPYTPPLPPPWTAEFETIPGVPGLEFPINPSNRNLHEEAQQTFQQMTRNLIVSMIDFISGLVDDIISDLSLGIISLRDWIEDVAGSFPFPLPTWQDVLDLLAANIRPICPSLPADPITVGDLADCLRATPTTGSPVYSFDELYAFMFSIEIPGFPSPPLPFAMPEPYVDTLQNPETMIIEGIKNLYSAMASSALTMLTDFLDFIMQIIPFTLPAVCVFIPIPDTTTTGLTNAAFPEIPPPPKQVAFFRWSDFTAGAGQEAPAGSTTDATYTSLSDMGFVQLDEERAVYYNRSSAGLTARVQDVDPDASYSVTLGSNVTVDTGTGFTNITPAALVGENLVAVAWQDSPVALQGTPGSVALLTAGASGTSLSKGATATFAQDNVDLSAAEPYSIIPLTADGSVDRFAITYQQYGGVPGSPLANPGAWIVVCRVSGTSVNVGPKLQLHQTHSTTDDFSVMGTFVRQRAEYNTVTGIATGTLYDRVAVAYDGNIRTVEINVATDAITAETEVSFGSGEVKAIKGMFTRHIMLAYDDKVTVAADYVNGFEFGNTITLTGAGSSTAVGMVNLNRPAENLYVYQNGTNVVGRILSTSTAYPTLGALTLVDETGEIVLASGTLGQVAPIEENKKLLLTYKNNSSDLESVVYLPNRI